MKRTILAVVVAALTATFTFGQAEKPTLSLQYVAAQEALAADNFSQAKAALTALANESQGDIRIKAQAAADATTIAGMRKAFKPLSEAVVKMNIPAGYTVAFCPMFERGSPWIQKKDGKIANPYFGKAMRTCGEFRNE